MSAEELIQKIANRIDNDNGYDNLLMAKDIAKISREYHAKEMERKLEEAKEKMSLAFKNTSNHVFYENGWIDGANWSLTHLKEQKQDN